MMYLAIKTLISAVLIVTISEIAKRSPAFAALVASLPLVSVLGMMWLWRDTQDTDLLASHAEATFWYVIPSLPMFLLVPTLLRMGVGFWPSLAAGVFLTAILYLLTSLILSKFGVTL
ncbi:DUF3147 family protein [Tepidicaulis sp. LMO-SS28]|uniref:DUF3147 family protein n=1 Tax=Tepidicaulis sp. LMO-SS28 TaxID=3447455 RepID=UPI003EE0A96F